MAEGGAATGAPRMARLMAQSEASFQPGETAVTCSVTATFQLR